VRPLVNARGTVTIVGASRVLPEVRRAMDAATREFIQIDELMDAVGGAWRSSPARSGES